MCQAPKVAGEGKPLGGIGRAAIEAPEGTFGRGRRTPETTVNAAKSFAIAAK